QHAADERAIRALRHHRASPAASISLGFPGPDSGIGGPDSGEVHLTTKKPSDRKAQKAEICLASSVLRTFLATFRGSRPAPAAGTWRPSFMITAVAPAAVPRDPFPPEQP